MTGTLHRLCLLLIVVGCRSAFGQVATMELFPEKSSVGLDAGFAFRSDCITHEFASAYFRHAFIDEQIKDRVSTGLDARNAFALDFGVRTYYRHRIQSDSGRFTSWGIELEDRHWIHSDFSSDAFELYFRGNRAYKGRSADLSNFRFSDLHWQAVKASVQIRLSSHSALDAGFGLVRGQEFLDIRTKRGSLYTAPNGDYLDADLDLTIRQQDSSGTGFDSWNGTGAVMDLRWKKQFRDGSLFEIGVSDFGFIGFDDGSSFVPADTTYRFEGIDATDLFDFTDTVSGTINSDSAFVQGFLTDRREESSLQPLPGLLRATYSLQWSEGKYTCTWEVQQRLFYAARPLARMEGSWSINRHHRLHLGLQYGEYTTWVAGLGYTLRLGSWQFHAGSRFLSGWINPEGRSAGAFVTLRKQLP